MSDYAVIGAGFGDEGKGKVVDYLCSVSPMPIVIRYCGGHQAGHHVMMSEDREHVFACYGSGTLRGVPTFWTKYCTVDPVAIVAELNVLNEKGIQPVLYIDSRCPVTTPFEIYQNKAEKQNIQHGSCGVGIRATYRREEDHISLCAGDLLNISVFKIKFKLLEKYYFEKGIHFDDPEMEVDMSLFYECCDKIFNTDSITVGADFTEITSRFHTRIFEGSQGLLLDQNYGFFPHVTPSNTGTTNILEMAFPFEVWLVSRGYQTRHGNGPMTNEELPHNITPNPYEKNGPDSFQGEFRTSLLDLDLLQYAVSRDDYIRRNEFGNRRLVLTCMDLIQNELRLTHNREIKNFVNEKKFIDYIKKHLGFGVIHTSSSPLSGAMNF